MATTPLFKLGQHLSALSIQGVTINATTGLMSLAGSAYSLTSVINNFRHTGRILTDDIRPITSTRINEVGHSIGHSVAITELKRSAAGAALTTIFATYSHAYVTWVEGTETFGGWFKVGDLENGLDGFGQQTVSLELRPVDPGEAQVSYSSSVSP